MDVNTKGKVPLENARHQNPSGTKTPLILQAATAC